MAQAININITQLSRRILMKKSLLTALLAVLVSASSAPAVPHPDADLLAAWGQYLEAMRLRDAMPPDAGEQQMEPYYALQDHYADRIIATRATTPEGVVVKLKYLLIAYAESWDIEHAYSQHGMVDPALVEEPRDRMLLALIHDVETMGA